MLTGADAGSPYRAKQAASFSAQRSAVGLERRLGRPDIAHIGFVSTLRLRPFAVVGEVINPGTYPYEPNLTVREAVVAAGGFTYRASRTWIHIRRAGAGEENTLRFDPQLAVEPGDTIRVGECRL